jgi:hypothetical protein
MHRFNLKDEEGRDASVAISSILHKKDYSMTSPEGDTVFRKYLQSTERCLFGPLSEEHGDDLGQKLVEADPEVDIEQVGRFVDETNSVFLADSGEILYSAPRVEEVRINPEGVGVNTREPVDHESNTQDATPVAATKKKYTKLEFVQSFLVARTVQIRHTDGLSYDWLHKWAKTLAEKGEIQMLAAGPKSNKPLIFQRNGTPYRAFLEGRFDDGKYKLLMHLSNMPLKREAGPFSTEFKD